MEIKPSPSTSRTSPPGSPREEVFLENYFQLVSGFSYDKAKDLAEKERDSHKVNFGSSWGFLVHLLSLLAGDEKAYMSLSFLGPKWFTRPKDNLQNSYQTLVQEFRKVKENVQQLGQMDTIPASEALLAHLCDQLEHFPMARQRTMDLYEQLTTVGNNRNFNFEDPVLVIKEVTQSYQKRFHHPLLSPLKTAFSLECEIIQHLMQTQILVAECNYLPSLLQLHQAHTKLASWGATLPTKEPKRSTFGSSSSRHGSWPTLYSWLVRYKNLLLSKFSIYFYETIGRNASPSAEMRTLCAKLPEDYYTKITNFEKKTDIIVFMIVLDTNGLSHRYTKHGYFHPKRTTPRPEGIDSYPTIFEYPTDRNIKKHWPSILMLISGFESCVHDKILWFYDKHAHSTYFISRVEPRISLVVLTDGKRSERDSHITNFLVEFTTQLRCTKHFAALKPS